MALLLVLVLSTTVFISLKGARVLATLFAVDLGAGPLETGILFALHGLFPFLLSVYAGRVADRFDNRLLMYGGIVGYAASLLLPFVFPSLPALFIATALGGFTSMLFIVVAQNLVGVLSSAEKRTRNFSFYSLGESSASVAGPVFVGFSIDAFRHPLTFFFLAVLTALCSLLLYAGRNSIPHTSRTAGKQGPRAMSDLLKLPAMRSALVTNGVVMAGLDLFNLYMPVYGHAIGFSATTIGMILGAFGVAAFITRLAIPPITARWGERAMLAGALGLSAAAFVTFPLTTSALFLGIAAFALGLGLGCGQPLSMILAFNAAPAGRSAEAIAMRLAVSYGAHVVIPPVFGVIGTGLGLAPIFWTCAILLAGGSLLNRRADVRQPM